MTWGVNLVADCHKVPTHATEFIYPTLLTVVNDVIDVTQLTEELDILVFWFILPAVLTSNLDPISIRQPQAPAAG